MSELLFLQRNRSTSHEWVDPPKRIKSDGYQTNSSTFGTLLSSQGSSAHRSTGLSACLGGNLVKLTGLGMSSQIDFLARFPCARSSCQGGRRPSERALVPPLTRRLARGVSLRGPAARPLGLASRRSLATKRTLGGRFVTSQIGSVWSGPQNALSQVRGRFVVSARVC